MPDRLPAETTRRALLLAAGAALAGCAAPAPIASRTTGPYPFTLGVASGDPWPDGFVLWTRLIPDRRAENGGMAAAPVDVVWEISRDPSFATVERTGTARADWASAHSVHVELGGLAPARDYWYRFRANGHASPTGRARTAPAPGTLPARLNFVACGCNNFEHGFFTAYRHIAHEAPDFAFHSGDYIYEYGPYRGPLPRVRQHEGAMCRTLDDYRRRYALYKSDPDLQAAHAATPFVMSFDDHEVADNWSQSFSRSSGTEAAFLARRNAALQAWYEHLPLRAAQRPTAAGTTMHRALAFGDLAAFDVLDTRQYRTRQPCGDSVQPACPEMDAAAAQMLGPAQEAWLYGQLANSRARWNFLAQQVAMMRIDLGRRNFNMDGWAGYTAARGRLHAFLERRKPANPVVLTGDWHRNWIGHLKSDYDNPGSATLAPEFAATSISSDGDPEDDTARRARVLPINPHLRHYSDRRGYMAFDLTPARLDVRLRSVASVMRPDAPVETSASYSVVAGDPRVHDA